MASHPFRVTSFQMFLRMEGPPVKGESLTSGHEEEIEVTDFSLEASKPGDSQAIAAAGKARISGLKIHKRIDLASPLLFLRCCDGTVFQQATLTVRERSGGSKSIPLLILEMKDVSITSLNWESKGSEVKLSESLLLSSSEYYVKYQAVTEKGAPGDQAEAGWDSKMNKSGSGRRA